MHDSEGADMRLGSNCVERQQLRAYGAGKQLLVAWTEAVAMKSMGRN